MLTLPREFRIFAAVMLAVFVSFPLQVFWLVDGATWSFVLGGAAFTPLNRAVMALALLSGVFALRASRWLLISAPVFLLAVAWNNWMVGEIGLNYSASAAWISFLSAVGVHGVLLHGGALKVLLHPELRWWKTPPRKRAEVRAVIYPVLGGELASTTFDVSEGGVFMALQIPLKGPRTFAVGDHCGVKLRMDPLNVLNCNAQIVRMAQSTGKYPEGLGLKFLNLSPEQIRSVRSFVSASI